MTAGGAVEVEQPAAQRTSPWAYLAAITPIIFGTTYLLTTQFLPPGRPLLAALMRSLPTGLVLIIGSRVPPRRWLVRFLILSVLYASGLFWVFLGQRLNYSQIFGAVVVLASVVFGQTSRSARREASAG